MSLKPKARLYFQASLTGGTEVTLPSDDSHYICNVMRLKPKSEILLFNEHDGEWLAILTDAHKKHARCAVMEQRKKPPSETKELRLIFAPLKKDRMDFLIEKAVELGVTHFVPVITEHADVQKVNLDRLRAQIKEAVEQCEQLYMPEITALQKISSYLETQHDGSPIFFCQEKGKAEALKKALSRPISSKDAIPHQP